MSLFGKVDGTLVDGQLLSVLKMVRSNVSIPTVIELPDHHGPRVSQTRVREVESLGARATYAGEIVPQIHADVPVPSFARLASAGIASIIWYDRPQYALEFRALSTNPFRSSGEQILQRIQQRMQDGRDESEAAARNPSILRSYLGARGPVNVGNKAAVFGLDDVRDFIGSTELDAKYDARGHGVKVAVLDTGADESHPMLQGAVAERETFVPEPAGGDLSGHGTWCASGIAGRPTVYHGRIAQKDGMVMRGMAPEAQLYIGKVLTGEGSGSLSGVIQGISWAVSRGVDIISMSLGSLFGEGGLGPDAKVVNEASKRGVRCVVASGNSFIFGAVGSPGSAAGAVTVGSVAMKRPWPGAIASFSSKGPTSVGRIKPDIVSAGGNLGPGIDEVILGATSGTIANESQETYGLLRGTSMATPTVAGLIAQLVPMGFPNDRSKIESVLADGSRWRADPTSFGARLPHAKTNRAGWGIADGPGFLSAIRRNLPGIPIREALSQVQGNRIRPILGAATGQLEVLRARFRGSDVRLTVI